MERFDAPLLLAIHSQRGSDGMTRSVSSADRSRRRPHETDMPTSAANSRAKPPRGGYFLPPRLTDWSLALAGAAAPVSGLISLGSGHADQWLVFALPGAAGLRRPILLWDKLRRVPPPGVGPGFRGPTPRPGGG